MRTTIELPEDHQSRLLELAARRGEEGFSSIVQEALTHYFQMLEQREADIERALSAVGSFSPEEADELEASVRELRSSWR